MLTKGIQEGVAVVQATDDKSICNRNGRASTKVATNPCKIPDVVVAWATDWTNVWRELERGIEDYTKISGFVDGSEVISEYIDRVNVSEFRLEKIGTKDNKFCFVWV